MISICLAGALWGLGGHAQPALFSDDFETDSSAQWNVLQGAGDGTPDFTAEFSFDYRTTKYTVTDASGATVTNTIPLAPNSAAGAGRGLKLTVNKDDNPATAGVSALLKGHTFSGNYALRCDMWLNYNGPRFGGTGSTEFGTFGINHSPDKVVWDDATVTDSDGSWFAVTGEGGAARDYRAYDGVTGARPVELRGFDAGFLDRNGDGTTEFETNPSQTAAEPLWQIFPSPEYETSGAPGKHWVQVEVAQRDGNLLWKINGFVIAERPNTSGFNSGTVMIGTMDVFSSIADPKADNYVIFDNVRVVNLDAEPAPATVAVEAIDAEAAEPGTDGGRFKFTRTGGDLSQPLDVSFRVSGTATPGKDFDAAGFDAGKVTIPANADSIDLPVHVLDDTIGELPESVTVTLTGSAAYEIRDRLQATVMIADDNDPTEVQVSVLRGQAFESALDVPGSFNIRRVGLTNADLTVKFALSGTATSGEDYEPIPTTVLIPAGVTDVTVEVLPKDDTKIEGDETVILTLLPDPDYVILTAGTATITIGDNEEADGTLVFSDDFNQDTSADYTLLFSAANGVADYSALFAYDYSADGIPAAPLSTDGSTKGLKLTVNKDATGSAAAINLYPKGKSFSGDFALRANMFLTFDSSLAGTTEHALLGLNHSGTVTNRHGAAGSDGVWFAIETDGSASRGGTYLGYVGNPTGTPALQNLVLPGPFAPYFPNPPYLAAGAVAGQWVEVEITQIAKALTWKINGITILTRANDTPFQSGDIMLGYMDSYNSIGAANNYVVFDNVRVVSFGSEPPPAPTISHIEVSNGTVQIAFTATGAEVSGLTVWRASSVLGPYQAASDATLQSTGDGQFLATLPQGADPAQFYRIQR